MARLFVGVDLPAAVKDHLASVVDRLRPSIEGRARWVPRENLHVTVQFLSSVEDARIREVSDAIASAVAGLVDVPVHLEHLGAFPSARRARVLWAGLDDPAGGTTALALAVSEALVPLGFEPESRAFTPHITLARLDPPRAVALHVALQPLRFVVDRATLYSSRLSNQGARYEALAVFPFRRPLAPPRPD